MVFITEEDIYGAFYSIIENGTGREIAAFFRQQLKEFHDDRRKKKMLIDALELSRKDEMCYEMRDIFETFISLAKEEYEEN